LDQASLLREMMSRMQQDKANSVAILSTSDTVDVELFLRRFARYSSKTLQKKMSLLGTEGEGKTIGEVMSGNATMDETKQKPAPYFEVFNGKLSFISGIRKNKNMIEKFIKEVKNIEENTDLFLYYTGEGLEPTTINLSLASDKAIIVMKPTTKSYMEVIKMVKIFSKMNFGNAVGIIVDTIDQGIFEEQIKKIQDYCWSEFKYNIEAIGFFETKYMPLLEDEQIFEGFDLGYLINKKGMKVFSDSISSMTF